MSKEFDQALSNFTHDLASGGAVRHLSDLGLSVYQIKERLDFPTPMDKIISMVWQHYIDVGIVCLDPPSDSPFIEKIDYITVYDEYGKPSFKQTVTREETVKREYQSVRFGVMKYKDRAAYEAYLDSLSQRSRDLIRPMPWPLTEVYVDRNYFEL